MVGPVVPDCVTGDVRRALEEDLGSGDLTAGLIPEDRQLQTRVICREEAVLAGRPWFDETFRQLVAPVSVYWSVQDGQPLEVNQEICRLEGNARAILSGERTALNFIQTLSGTATATRNFVTRVSAYPCRILDTRKTIPGLRRAQKYAVLCGGGHNHRIGLFDAILIKENHISAAGSITAAVREARSGSHESLIEAEVESLEELREALEAGADRALLDNFSLDMLKQAVGQYSGRIELEASGDVTLDTVERIAATGVDFISTGAITKHVRAVDFSMRFTD